MAHSPGGKVYSSRRASRRRSEGTRLQAMPQNRLSNSATRSLPSSVANGTAAASSMPSECRPSIHAVGVGAAGLKSHDQLRAPTWSWNTTSLGNSSDICRRAWRCASWTARCQKHTR